MQGMRRHWEVRTTFQTETSFQLSDWREKAKERREKKDQLSSGWDQWKVDTRDAIIGGNLLRKDLSQVASKTALFVVLRTGWLELECLPNPGHCKLRSRHRQVRLHH